MQAAQGVYQGISCQDSCRVCVGVSCCVYASCTTSHVSLQGVSSQRKYLSRSTMPAQVSLTDRRQSGNGQATSGPPPPQISGGYSQRRAVISLLSGSHNMSTSSEWLSASQPWEFEGASAGAESPAESSPAEKPAESPAVSPPRAESTAQVPSASHGYQVLWLTLFGPRLAVIWSQSSEC